MSNLALQIRPARQDDAAEVARVYIDSWHDTYPGVLPTSLLRAITSALERRRLETELRRSASELRERNDALVAHIEQELTERLSKAGIVAGDGSVANDFVTLSPGNWTDEGHVIDLSRGADVYELPRGLGPAPDRRRRPLPWR